MALGKVKRRGLCHLPPIRIVVLFFLFIFCNLNVWVRKSRNKIKRSLKVLKRNLKKYAETGGVNKNKQIEYTKELMKEIPIEKCMEAGDKCNSMIRTKRVD